MKITSKDKIPLKGVYKFTVRDIHTGKVEVFEYENVVTRDFWELIANNIIDPTPDNSLYIMEAALGTGTDTPSVEDSALQTEVYRNNLVSKGQNSDNPNIVEATAHFNATEVSGTFREAGVFTVDNILVSHVAINVSKTTSQTLTWDFSLTVGA